VSMCTACVCGLGGRGALDACVCTRGCMRQLKCYRHLEHWLVPTPRAHTPLRSRGWRSCAAPHLPTPITPAGPHPSLTDLTTRQCGCCRRAQSGRPSPKTCWRHSRRRRRRPARCGPPRPPLFCAHPPPHNCAHVSKVAGCLPPRFCARPPQTGSVAGGLPALISARWQSFGLRLLPLHPAVTPKVLGGQSPCGSSGSPCLAAGCALACHDAGAIPGWEARHHQRRAIRDGEEGGVGECWGGGGVRA